MKYLQILNQEPTQNTALDALLINNNSNVYFAATFLKPTVILGKTVNYAHYVENENTTPVRYIGFGGPVYFDENVIKASIIIDKENVVENFKKFKKWITESLKTIGVDIDTDLRLYGVDGLLLIDGVKFGDSALVTTDKKLMLSVYIALEINKEANDSMILSLYETDNHCDCCSCKNPKEVFGLNTLLDKPVTIPMVLEALSSTFKDYWGEDLEKVELKDMVDLEELNDLTKEFSTDKWIKNGQL